MNFNESYIGLRLDLLQQIEGKDLHVLDIGCATGVNGQYLKDKSIAKKVIGVEISPKMAEEAKERLDMVVIGNIEDNDTFQAINKEKYHYVLIGDVLEHLYDPWELLRQLKYVLHPKGKILFSVPNIQHIELFIKVYIKGEWSYNDRGIFDKTHLRWFTLKNIIQLEEKCGIKIIRIGRNYRFRDRIDSEFPFYGRVLRRIMPSYFTIQYVVLAEYVK